MKKIFVAIAVLAAITFTSCGNSTNEATDQDTTEVAADTTEEEVDLEEALQNGDVDAIKAEVDKVQELIASGDTAEAKKYAYKLQEFAANHKDDLDGLATGEVTVADLINGIKNLPNTGKAVANEAKDAATSDAKTVKQEVKAAAKEKANEEADKAVQKANEATTKAVNEAAEAAKKKLGL